jgi:hypothetical protein
MFGRFRSLLSHSRIPFKVDAANAKVYRVRFVKPQRQKGGANRFFYLLSSGALTVILGIKVVQTMSLSGQPIFIPLGFPKQEPPQKFKNTDPEVRAFVRFANDRSRCQKARRVFENKTVEILKKSLPGQIGNEVKTIHSLLYFHYPQGPPPSYSQKGLQIVYKPPDPTSTSREDQYSVIEVDYCERRLKFQQQLRRESILYPRWMFQAVSNSIRDIWADITSPREPDEDAIEGFDDLVQYGVDLSQWTFQNLKDDLKKTKPKMPPPNGYVIIDGMVQVTTNNVIITVDLTGSFNPENPEQATVHRMGVRFATKRPQPQRQKILSPELGKPLDVSKAVVTGLKKDIAAAAKTAVKNDDELIDEPKDQEKRKIHDATSQSIVERLVEVNGRAEQESKLLEAGKRKEDQVERHNPREDTTLPSKVQDIDNSSPATPSGPQQSSPPPRE